MEHHDHSMSESGHSLFGLVRAIFIIIGVYVLLKRAWDSFIGLLRANNSDEAWFYGLHLSGAAAGIYAFLGSVILIYINCVYDNEILTWWPSVSGLFGLGSENVFSVAWDWLFCIVLMFVCPMVAKLFGSINENTGEYVRSNRSAKSEHIAEIEARIVSLRNRHPSKTASYIMKPGQEQRALVKAWETDLAKQYQALENVRRMYN